MRCRERCTLFRGEKGSPRDGLNFLYLNADAELTTARILEIARSKRNSTLRIYSLRQSVELFRESERRCYVAGLD